ncbi:MAG: PLP-dependent aminotransferase family protein, partial [Myxococcota bacterium]
YRELELQGWIETRPAQGTYIADELPVKLAAARRTGDADVGFALRRREWSPRRRLPFPLLGGLPDMSSVPTAALARAYRRSIRGPSHRLGYGHPAGEDTLREALATHLRESRGLSHTSEAIMVTRGSQQALHLLALALLSPGDRVAVESLGYRPAHEALRSAGARLLPISLDDEGLMVERLEAKLAEGRIRAVYVTPHHQYPTTVTMSPRRRRALLQLVARHRIAVLEDDYDHEFHFDGRPVLPLGARDRAGVVVHIGTFSKVLAPALRIGWVAAPKPLIETLTAIRTTVDRQGDRHVERAVAELLDEGEITRHALRMRRVYRRRRACLIEALQTHLPDALTFEPPRGGLARWAHTGDVNADEWKVRAEAQGVLVQSTNEFTQGPRKARHFRIGYASLDETGLRDAVRRLAAARQA